MDLNTNNQNNGTSLKLVIVILRSLEYHKFQKWEPEEALKGD
jgi:hypothetical protein